MTALLVAVGWPGRVDGQDLRDKADVARTGQDMDQLSKAIQEFQNFYEVGFIPSRIKLSETGKYDPRRKLDAESVAFLTLCWRGIVLDGIDWNGSGKIDAPDQGGDVVLEGDQCLVFFLGGIAGTKGFSTDKRNPAANTPQRVGPFFDFPAARLKSNGNQAGKSGYRSFQDVYGTNLYAYFSSGGSEHSYNKHGTTDCETLKVWPYASELKPAPRYELGGSFQIVCAGKDGKFGPGTVLPNGLVWDGKKADRIHPAGSPGADDLANFHEGLLGKPK